jgi:hypothetical protein
LSFLAAKVKRATYTGYITLIIKKRSEQSFFWKRVSWQLEKKFPHMGIYGVGVGGVAQIPW